nr:hypothetical protein [Glaciibacter superstes]
MGERAENQFWVVVKVGRVSGHQRDAAARGDNSGSNEKLVDPMQDARFAAVAGVDSITALGSTGS